MSAEIWRALGREIEDYRSGIRTLPVFMEVAPAEIRQELAAHFSFEEPMPLPEVVERVREYIRRWNLHVTHPRYFGLFNPSVHSAGIAGETLAALYNLQVAGWSHAPAANEMERHVLRHLASAVGFDPERTLGTFTTGGAEANLSAVLAALAHHFPEDVDRGVAALERPPAIYVSSETHHSFVKIARMTGLGLDALREVDVTPAFGLDPAALRARIRSDRKADFHPLMVVATAGTTGGGVIDSLEELAEVAREQGAWYHVDGAWGASAALSARLRRSLEGIELADSVTWDAHKWLSVPMGAGILLCRHPDALARAFAVDTTYMPDPSGAEAVDNYLVTAQWSRRAIGLKLFMTMATLGNEGYARTVERQADMGDHLRARLRAEGWRIVNQTPLPLICFTHPELARRGLSTRDLLRVIYDRGRVWLSDVSLAGGPRVLRACITSFRTNEEDLEVLLEELDHALGVAGTGRFATREAARP